MSRTSVELAEVAPAHLSTPSQTTLASSRRRSDASSHEVEVTTAGSIARVETSVSKSRTTAIIICITMITSISTLSNGLTTVALPTSASDSGSQPGMSLWPSSIQALTCGCTLLLSGSLSDASGSRLMYSIGCILQAGFVLGCGSSRNGAEIISFRGLSGVAISFCSPSAVSIITSSFTGKRRNMAFAAMGGGQPVGFSVGLSLGGVLTDTIGWRVGFYIAAGVNTLIFAIALWGLPPSAGAGARLSWGRKWQQIKNDIDWVGASIASASSAMLSYVFASITGSTSDIKEPASIALLSVAVASIPVFVLWVGRQERLGRPAIIPNSLWRNRIFTTVCVMVFCIWGAFNSLETILTFYFQDVQHLSATQTSLRFLPSPVSGSAANIIVGMFVHKVRANILAVTGIVISCAAPLAMVFAGPTSSYWDHAFIANLLNPTGADALFTISNLLITSVFPPKTQGLAGGVFNTISQIGKSVGLALVAVIASTTTANSSYVDKSSPDALMAGYKATFWFCFAITVATLAMSGWGLRGIGNVGHKRD